MTKKFSSKWVEIIFIIFLFLLYFIWALTIPYGGGPDEAMRYDIPEYIYHNYRIPYGWEEEIRNPVWGFSYGFFSIFSYILSGILMIIVGIFTTDFKALLMAARMVSILSMVGTGWLALHIGEEIFGDKYKWVFASLVSLLPEVAFLAGYINIDAFSLFTVALTYYMLLQGKKRAWDYRSCIKLGVSLGLVLLGYYNAYIVVICAAIYCIADVLKNMKMEGKLKFILIRIALVLGGCLLVCGWYFIRNFVLYDGDLLGINAQRKYGELYAIDGYKPSQRGAISTDHSISYFLFDLHWIKVSCCSFIAVLGNMDIFMPDNYYKMFYFIFGFAIVGAIVSVRWKKNREKRGILAIVFLINIIGSIVLSIYYSYFNDFQPQGRYCMPMVFGIMYFFTYGIRGWLKIVNNSKVERIVQGIFVVLIFGVSIWTLGEAYIGYQRLYG